MHAGDPGRQSSSSYVSASSPPVQTTQLPRSSSRRSPPRCTSITTTHHSHPRAHTHAQPRPRPRLLARAPQVTGGYTEQTLQLSTPRTLACTRTLARMHARMQARSHALHESSSTQAACSAMEHFDDTSAGKLVLLRAEARRLALSATCLDPMRVRRGR